MSVECVYTGCGLTFDTRRGMKIHHANTHGESISGFVYECSNCDKEYQDPRSGLEDSQEYTFCSVECSEEYLEDDPLDRTKTVKRECSNCGNTVERKPSESEKYENVFCDSSCYGDWQSLQTGEDNRNWDPGNHINVNCSWCDEDLVRDKYVVEQNDLFFCNASECQARYNSEHLSGPDNPLWQGEIVECQWCGQEKSITPTETERYDNHFCDLDCCGKWRSENMVGEDAPRWKGGVSDTYYGPEWKRQRRKTLERDDFTCRSCGMEGEEHRIEYSKQLHVHHIIRFLSFEHSEDANRLSNLVTLCKDCHKTAEKMPKKDQRAMFMSTPDSYTHPSTPSSRAI